MCIYIGPNIFGTVLPACTGCVGCILSLLFGALLAAKECTHWSILLLFFCIVCGLFGGPFVVFSYALFAHLTAVGWLYCVCEYVSCILTLWDSFVLLMGDFLYDFFGV